ncbi:hypothetical protein [Acinetobacter amyesii]|uniref:hypothetical protein n=1 Tax=Acinetobacter amyesii TaxID=2942470 RepID=UPI0020BE23B6|nr:hypothetical protein [Acinetobacter amyesii]MCL6231797.1 hypothetical protein [Acinetobacter amyesii]
MPIDSVKHSIHIRRKKNAVVFQNIARLWDIGRNTKTHQELLDGLHPWNAPITLKFENLLPLALAALGIGFMLFIVIQPDHGWAQLCFAAGLAMVFWAYISYEKDDPLEDVIAFLETECIARKYQLAFNRQPQYISMPLNNLQFIGNLKRMFPVFKLGSLSNDIQTFASTVWEDENQQQYQVMVFHYHYVNELKVRDKDGDEVTVKEIHKDLWGVFVFDIGIHGLAVSTTGKNFGYPYSFPWHSSDIQTNQKLKFYGENQMEIAKLLSPGFVLRLADFFQNREGDLLFHPSHRIMCYLGSTDLFKVSSKAKRIQDVSALRGHLRTFKLNALENLKNDLTQFLK